MKPRFFGLPRVAGMASIALALGCARASGTAYPAEPPDEARDSQEERFAQALGRAVIATWSDLAQADQERIFECAVVLGHHDERDEMLREQLARFLHDRHERTTHRETSTRRSGRRRDRPATSSRTPEAHDTLRRSDTSTVKA